MNKRQYDGGSESCGAFQRMETVNKEQRNMGNGTKPGITGQPWPQNLTTYYIFPWQKVQSNTENIRLKLKLHISWFPKPSKNYKRED